MADALDRNALIAEMASCIAALARGDDEHARDILGGLVRAFDATSQSVLPGIPGPPPAMSSEMAKRSAVGRIFAYWQERCDHKQAKLTPDRTRAILARLKEGYTEAEVRKAIEGAAVAAFVNDDGHKYDDLTLICRNGSKLESFISRGVTATGAIVVEVGDGSSIEEKIANLRSTMSAMKRDGRDTEYQAATVELTRLMQQRNERKAQ